MDEFNPIIFRPNLDDLEKYIEYLKKDPNSLTKEALNDGAGILRQEIENDVSGKTVSFQGQSFTVNKRTGRLMQSVALEYPWGDPLTARIFANAVSEGGVDYAAFLQKGKMHMRRKDSSKSFAMILTANGHLVFLDRNNFAQYVQVQEAPRKSYFLTGAREKQWNRGKVPYYECGTKHWVTVRGGKLIFRKEINIKPHPFIEAAYEAKKDEVAKNIAEAYGKDIIKYEGAK